MGFTLFDVIFVCEVGLVVASVTFVVCGYVCLLIGLLFYCVWLVVLVWVFRWVGVGLLWWYCLAFLVGLLV